MKMRTLLLAAAGALCVFTTAASAQGYGPPPGMDPNGYYSQSDQRGYYDHNGRYRRMPGQYDRRDDGARAEGAYYRQGEYEQNCRRGNAAAGTIFGALAGGLLGNTIARDIDCDDQPYAFRVYSDGLNGDLGRRYDWNHGDARGYFQPTREFRRGGMICRDFIETTYREGRELARNGTACRAQDGHWRFD